MALHKVLQDAFLRNQVSKFDHTSLAPINDKNTSIVSIGKMKQHAQSRLTVFRQGGQSNRQDRNFL